MSTRTWSLCWSLLATHPNNKPSLSCSSACRRHPSSRLCCSFLTPLLYFLHLSHLFFSTSLPLRSLGCSYFPECSVPLSSNKYSSNGRGKTLFSPRPLRTCLSTCPSLLSTDLAKSNLPGPFLQIHLRSLVDILFFWNQGHPTDQDNGSCDSSSST